MRSDLARWRESEWQLGRALYDMISRWKRMGRFAILMGSYTHLIFLCPSPASHQGGMRNGEQMFRRDHAVLVSSVGFCLLVGCLRCVGYACAYGVRRPPFFNSKKRKQKMPLSCAEGGSAQRKALCGSHTMRWPARWVARGRWVARRPCALCAMVLSEGLLGWHFARAYLTYCVTARGSFAVAYRIRATENQFGIIRKFLCRIRTT